MSKMGNGPPFALPLSLAQFEAALRTGHGRALLHARQFGLRGWEDSLLFALRTNQVYDVQCEPSRGPWLVELAAGGGVAETVFPVFISESHPVTSASESRNTNQRCEILKLLAQRGDAAARNALYEMLAPFPETDDWPAAEEIIELDGFGGFRRVASVIGRVLRTTGKPIGEEWLPQWIGWRFDKPEGAALKQLRAHAATDEDLDSYVRYAELRAAERAMTSGPAQWGRPPDPDIASMREHILSESLPGRLLGWGKRAATSDLATIAGLFDQPLSERQTIGVLTFFSRRCYPPLIDRFLTFTTHPESPRIRVLAWRCAGQCENDRVRDAAFCALAASPVTIDAFEGLFANLREADGDRFVTLVNRAVRECDDEFARHTVLSDVIAAMEHRFTHSAAEAMFVVYEHGPCSTCRARSVKLLREASHAPDWMLEEFKCDAVSLAKWDD